VAILHLLTRIQNILTEFVDMKKTIMNMGISLKVVILILRWNVQILSYYKWNKYLALNSMY